MNIKKNFLIKITIILLFLVNNSFSSNLILKLGFLSSSINTSQDVDVSRKIGFTGGASLLFPATNNLALGVDIIYSQKGATYIIPQTFILPETKIEENLNYLEINPTFNFYTYNSKEFSFIPRFSPSFNIFLDGTIKTTAGNFSNEDAIDKDNINTLDIGILFGTYFIIAQYVVLDFSYYLGLTDINKNENYKDKINNFSFMFGIKL